MHFQYTFRLYPLRFYIETKSIKANPHLEYFITTRSEKFDKEIGSHKEDLQVFYMKEGNYMNQISQELDNLGGHYEVGLVD